MRKLHKMSLLLMTFALVAGGIAFAGGEQEGGDAAASAVDKDLVVDFVEVQWSDIASTTAATRVVLEAAGYETTTEMVSVPIAFESVRLGDVDVFLGDWEPSMASYKEELVANDEIVDYRVNLTGAKYTLAVPAYLAEKGLTNFANIADFAEELDYKIYGIEPGNDGNMLIQKMIDSDAFGLGEFEVVASSEAGMLAQVKTMVPGEEAIVFLGWEPHPMNTNFDMTYLEGGDDFFGPNLGAATVHTILRTGYAEENPNLARFFSNLEFTLAMENEIMNMLNSGMKPLEAAEKWLMENPVILDSWLKGVKTPAGDPALPAVKSALGL